MGVSLSLSRAPYPPGYRALMRIPDSTGLSPCRPKCGAAVSDQLPKPQRTCHSWSDAQTLVLRAPFRSASSEAQVKRPCRWKAHPGAARWALLRCAASLLVSRTRHILRVECALEACRQVARFSNAPVMQENHARGLKEHVVVYGDDLDVVAAQGTDDRCDLVFEHGKVAADGRASFRTLEGRPGVVPH